MQSQEEAASATFSQQASRKLITLTMLSFYPGLCVLCPLYHLPPSFCTTNQEQPRPEYITFDIQVHTVDYMNQESLSYALRGIDLVISTVSGAEQMNLIQAAGEGSVRHFVPAEFEGKLSATRRASADDPLRPNSMSTQTFNLLRHYEQRRRMKHTVFSCGILMETFHPDGLGHFNMGAGVGLQNPGDFLLNINTAAATYTHRNTSNRRVHVCLTSAYDLAQFIVAALEIGPANWPSEYTLRGDRLSVEELVNICSRLRNGKCAPETIWAEKELYSTSASQFNLITTGIRFQSLLPSSTGRHRPER